MCRVAARLSGTARLDCSCRRVISRRSRARWSGLSVTPICGAGWAAVRASASLPVLIRERWAPRPSLSIASFWVAHVLADRHGFDLSCDRGSKRGSDRDCALDLIETGDSGPAECAQQPYRTDAAGRWMGTDAGTAAGLDLEHRARGASRRPVRDFLDRRRVGLNGRVLDR